MAEIVAAIGLRRDGRWDVEHHDGRKEILTPKEMDQRSITVRYADEVKNITEGEDTKKAVPNIVAMREALENARDWFDEWLNNPTAETITFGAEWTMEMIRQTLEASPGQTTLAAQTINVQPTRNPVVIQAARLRMVVKSLEWMKYFTYDDGKMGNVVICPWCRRTREQGHSDDCIVGQALAGEQG